MDSSYNNGLGAQIPQGSSQNNFQQPIVSSGTGDIVLNDGGNEKKKSHKMIILIVLIVLFVLVGGGLLLWQSGVFGQVSNSGQTEQTSSLGEKYNSYVNYVLSGEESTEKPDMILIDEMTPYFETIDGRDVKAYSTEVDTKFMDLQNEYSAKMIGDKIDLGSLKLYFEDFAQIWAATHVDLLGMVTERGERGTKTVINDNLAKIDKVDGLAEYGVAMKNFYDVYLGIVVKIIDTDCVKDGRMIGNCYRYSEEEQSQLEDASIKVVETEKKLHDSAISALKKMYSNIYGTSLDDSTETNGGSNE